MCAANVEQQFASVQFCPPTIPGQNDCEEFVDREELAVQPSCVPGKLKFLSSRHYLKLDKRGGRGSLVDTE